MPKTTPPPDAKPSACDRSQGDRSQKQPPRPDIAAAMAAAGKAPIFDDPKDSRLRALAFYYLGLRERSAHELEQKLIAKGHDADAARALVKEFAAKGHQSDRRFAECLVREHLRKGRGLLPIKAALAKSKAHLDIDPKTLIAQVLAETQAASDKTDDGRDPTDDKSQSVDWLKLAIDARCKKYGDAVPTDPKEKARQLRFLQYRGFDAQVSFAALKHTPASYQEALLSR